MPVPNQKKESGEVKSKTSTSSSSISNSSSSSSSTLSTLEQVMAYADLPNDFETISGLTVRQNYYIAAHEGCGKTGLVLRHWPKPVALIGYDGRAREEVEKAKMRGETVYYLNIPWSKLGNWSDPTKLKAEAREVLNRTIQNLKWSVGQSLRGNIGTICVDGGSELSEIIDLSFDGKSEDRGDVWGKDTNYVGKRFWGIYELVSLSNAHFVVTTRAVQEFAKGKKEPTGKHTYKGNKVIGQASNIGLYLELDLSRHEGVSKKNLDPENLQVVTVTKAGRDLKEIDKRYTKDDWGEFGPMAYATWKQNRELFPEMTIEDWRKKP